MDVARSNMHPAELVEIYEEKRRRWRDSQDRHQLYERMKEHKPENGWHIAKAFCIGVGSLQGRRDPGAARLIDVGRSLAQLAIFMDMVESLNATNSSKIEVLVAEHLFNSNDYEVLRLLDIPAHRSDVDALNLISAGDLVFCPYVGFDWFVLSKLPENLPTLYIGLEPAHVKHLMENRYDSREVTIDRSNSAGSVSVCIKRLSAPDDISRFAAFPMTNAQSTLGCLRVPLGSDIWMYCQECATEDS